MRAVHLTGTRQRIDFETPYAITDHAILRFQQRVDPTADRRQAIARINALLQRPYWWHVWPNGERYQQAEDRSFTAVVVPPAVGRTWPVVVTLGKGWDR